MEKRGNRFWVSLKVLFKGIKWAIEPWAPWAMMIFVGFGTIITLAEVRSMESHAQTSSPTPSYKDAVPDAGQNAFVEQIKLLIQKQREEAALETNSWKRAIRYFKVACMSKEPGDLEKAREAARQVGDAYPQALIWLGIVSFTGAESDAEEARRSLKELEHPANYEFWVDLAEITKNKKDIAAARKDIEFKVQKESRAGEEIAGLTAFEIMGEGTAFRVVHAMARIACLSRAGGDFAQTDVWLEMAGISHEKRQLVENQISRCRAKNQQ